MLLIQTDFLMLRFKCILHIFLFQQYLALVSDQSLDAQPSSICTYAGSSKEVSL